MHTCFTLGGPPVRRGCSGVAFRGGEDGERERARTLGPLASSFSPRKWVLAGGAFTASQIAPVSIYVLGACARRMPFHSLSASRGYLSLSLPRFALHSAPIRPLAPSHSRWRTPRGRGARRREDAGERSRAAPLRERRTRRARRARRREDATESAPSRRDRGRGRAWHEGERVREPERLRGERSQLVIRSPPTDERAATERDPRLRESTRFPREKRGRYTYIKKKGKRKNGG